MVLSKKAQEVLDLLEKVRTHKDTESYIIEYEGKKSFPVDNILNGHIECQSTEYKTLLNDLSTIMVSYLITEKGQNSGVYYELKNAGYSLIIAEQDAFGPLCCGIKCPNTDWWVYYG